MTAPIDLAQRACAKHTHGETDWHYVAIVLSRYIETQLTDGAAGRTALASPRRAASLQPGSSSLGVGSPLSSVDQRVLQEWREQASCYDAGGGE